MRPIGNATLRGYRSLHRSGHEDHGYVVVSKDEDFTALSGLRGRPPCLIKISVGNCTNEDMLQVLLNQQTQIESVFVDAAVSMVELIRDTR